MDAVFTLGEEGRANFIQHMMQSFGCTYICLWSYSPHPSNCLIYKDGFYQQRSSQPSSSLSGSLAQSLFNRYSQSVLILDPSFIPGLAFVNNTPFMELQSTDLQRMASTEVQRQFYQEAGIKNAIFMRCNTGEIELGFSDDHSQVNVEMEMRRWLFEDPNTQLAPTRDLSQPSTDQNRPASSSSSLRSLSYDSPEYNPLLFDVPSTSYHVPVQQQEAMVQQALGSSVQPAVRTMSTTPHQQAIRAISQIRNVQLPTIESEDDAMTRAILAVISSPLSSTSSSLQSQQQNLPPNRPASQASAFRSYRSALSQRMPTSSRTRRHNMLKRSFAFLQTLNAMRTHQQTQSGRTSSTLHHMIAERRRREKINESFQTLRSLLPPGTKKDKASVLVSTTEYLESLRTQIAELSQRNQTLEAQLLPRKSAATGSSNERIEVQITNVETSSSAARFVNLQVTVRGDVSMTDLVVSLLEFLKTDTNVNLTSIDANTNVADTTVVNSVFMRLRIEDGDEWDESAFQEAIRRIVNDFAQ